MIEDQLDPKFSFVYDGAMVNIYHPKKGEGLPKHVHNYQHATFCVAGSLIVRKENFEATINKDSKPINLKENEWHELEATQDGTIFINIFSADKV